REAGRHTGRRDGTDRGMVAAVRDVLDELVRMDDLLVRLVPEPLGDAGEVLLVGLDGQLAVGDRRGELERDLLLELLLKVIAHLHEVDSSPVRRPCHVWKGSSDLR